MDLLQPKIEKDKKLKDNSKVEALMSMGQLAWGGMDKKKKKPIIFGLIIVLLLLLSGVVNIFYWLVILIQYICA